MAHVESQLHRGRELVDVLPARTGGADEALDELALLDRDVVGDADHAAGSLLVMAGLVPAIHAFPVETSPRRRCPRRGRASRMTRLRPAGQIVLRQHPADASEELLRPF